MTTRAEHLVIDTGGFIKNDMGSLHSMADNLVTLQEVISELRDKEVRQRVRNTPVEMTYSSPSSEAIRRISEFARKTGDYASLSLVDISVIAVAYDLEVSKNGSSHLKTEPTIKKTTQFYHPKDNKEKNMKADSKLPGFFLDDALTESESNLPKSDSFDQFNFWREPVPEVEDLPEDASLTSTKTPSPVNNDSENLTENPEILEQLNKFLLKRPFVVGFDVTPVDFTIWEIVKNFELKEDLHLNVLRWSKNIQSHESLESEDVDISKVLDFIANDQDFTVEDAAYDEDEEDGEETESNDDHGYDSDKENEEIDEEDDDDGWITPGNLKSKKAVIAGDFDKKVNPERVSVALMTTDFAMQNVCKQMGLNIIGTNGMLITETKTWILRCYFCYKTTPDMSRKFCPKCGNPTLKRVAVTLNEDGSQQIHISTRKPISTKGKKFSLPAPKGGKHAWNPRLTEDQREPQQRLSKKSLRKNNPMGEDFLAGNSPFVTRDVTSKSAMLGLAGTDKGNAAPSGFYWTQRNPNVVRKNTGNRRKKNK